MDNVEMNKEKLYEGKAKVVYPGDNPAEVYMVFKDSATAFDGKKKGVIQGKGYFNAQISAILFKYLEGRGVKTHFLGLSDDRTMRARRLEIFPVEVVVRNIVAGSLSKRMGRPEGEDLPIPIVEFYLKSDELGDPMVNDDHIVAFGLATREEIQHLREEAKRINSLLEPFFFERELLLVDFKLEFGRIVTGAAVPGTYGARELATSASGEPGEERPGALEAEKVQKERLSEIVLGDEISPDTCRLWDVKTREKLDKDRFRRALGRVEAAYAEVLRRISR